MTKIAEGSRSSGRSRTRRRRAGLLMIVGVGLLVAGLSCFGYVGYQLWGTNISAHKAYDQERQQLKHSWSQPPSSQSRTQPSGSDDGTRSGDLTAFAPIPGHAIALISIPSIGVDQVPIIEGTGLDVLARGVGHYRNTAGPGQVGNFALAGHRITHGEPFANLLKMNRGDKIIIQTRDKIFTYQLDKTPRSLTVEDTEGWVIDPVPGHPQEQPTQRLITLTTCQDLFHSPDRSVGFGHLVSVATR